MPRKVARIENTIAIRWADSGARLHILAMWGREHGEALNGRVVCLPCSGRRGREAY